MLQSGSLLLNLAARAGCARRRLSKRGFALTSVSGFSTVVPSHVDPRRP
jgi:hypothetical protein